MNEPKANIPASESIGSAPASCGGCAPPESRCRQCGKCCHAEIPLTIPDVHRIAQQLGCSDRQAFERSVQAEISGRTWLFMIRKTEQRACVFLREDNLCSIHEGKPWICRTYDCGSPTRADSPVTVLECAGDDCHLRLWEQSVARSLTEAYGRAHGARWHEWDYHRALSEFQEMTAQGDFKHVKLGRHENGIPMAMVYDCSECERRAAGAVETPVTLLDIARIARHLGIQVPDVFRDKLVARPSKLTGGLMLRRNGTCIFHDKTGCCSIEKARPMHCRFVACPLRANSSNGLADRFYLGSGTVQEQYRHQIALAFTRDYVAQFGVVYSPKAFEAALGRIEAAAADSYEYRQFCRKIAAYRYTDDATPLAAAA